MKTIAAVLVLFAGAAQAQQYWDWEQPTPTAETFNDVSESFTPGSGIAVGTGGVLYQVSGSALPTRILWDGGTQLTSSLNVITSVPCGGFCFFQMVGGSGGVLLSNASGTFARVNSPTSGNIVGLHFESSTQGWLLTDSGEIWMTTNGGATWTAQSLPAGSTLLHAVAGPSSSSAAFIARDPQANGHSAMKFNGTAWVDVATTPLRTFTAVDGVSASQMFFGGKLGALARYNGTTDSWLMMDAGFATQVRDLDSNSGVADPALGGRHHIFTYDPSTGVVTAQATPAAVPPNISALGITGNSVIVGEGGLVETYSAGAWSMVSRGQTRSTYDAVVINGANGLVAGLDGFGRAVVRPRSNGTWGAETVLDGGQLNDIALSSSGEAWAVGVGGEIFHSASVTGGTWAQQPSGTFSVLSAVALVVDGTPSTLVAVGNGSTILRSTNAGASWAAATVTLADGGTPTSGFNLTGVSFPSATVGYAAGDSTLLKTTNGGATWTPTAGPNFGTIAALDYSDPSHGYVVAQLGGLWTAWYTGNGGGTWNRFPLPDRSCPRGTGYRKIIGSPYGTVAALHDCGGVISSANYGIAWTPFPAPWTSRLMLGLAGGGGANKDLWAVGEHGAILRSQCGGGPLVGMVACNDGNACTSDSCNPATGACTHTPTVAACDDGNDCTSGDYCDAGRCVGSAAVSCDDGNECTADSCAPNSGCQNEPLIAALCDDGNPCTVGDLCSGTQCVGTGPQCDRGNPCEVGGCAADGGCLFTAKLDGTPCSDGDLCTQGDACMGGVCTATAVSCDDGNGCTADSCAPDAGCGHVALTGSCSTGNVCVTGETCSGAVCGGGTAISCDDHDPCTDDTCSPDAGCAHTFRGAGASCSDGLACTVGETCQGDGGCSGGQPNACDDGSSCTADLCSEPGGCAHMPLAASTPCTDGDQCTLNDRCNATGQCVGVARVCDDLNPCTVDSCDPMAGCVAAALADFSACDDGNDCNSGDHCEGGACRADAGPDCDDQNPCTLDVCNASTGNLCQHAARDAGTVCSDGNPCTEGDQCTGLSGMGCVGVAKGCDDFVACTDDTCDPGTGICQNTARATGASCDDGNSCTNGDACNATGQCVGTQKCDDGNACTQDSCALDGGTCSFAAIPMCAGAGGGGAGTGGGGGAMASGGGSGEGGGATAGAGGGLAMTPQKHCGCGSEGGAAVLLGLVTLRRRRRDSQSNPRKEEQ
jgi:photosystem II stability/assembly factor-like uncharacterized protein